jgi:hypothetical protein
MIMGAYTVNAKAVVEDGAGSGRRWTFRNVMELLISMPHSPVTVIVHDY